MGARSAPSSLARSRSAISWIVFEPHVVGQAGAEAPPLQKGQPRQAADLIRPEGAEERARLGQLLYPLSGSEAGGEVGQGFVVTVQGDQHGRAVR